MKKKGNLNYFTAAAILLIVGLSALSQVGFSQQISGVGAGTCTRNSNGAITCAATGSNQNITLTPSGTGSTLLNGNVGVGTTTPAGVLSVASIDAGTANPSLWSSAFSIFGPNVSSATGAALGLGYSTTLGAAEILALQPGLIWKPLEVRANTISLLSGGITQGLFQNSSGNIGVGTTTPQAIFDVAGQARVKPVTFATLAACSTTIEGEIAAVTDSTTAIWGATITGAGTNHVLAYCDGTAWTVTAK